jgi:hypothetical protein
MIYSPRSYYTLLRLKIGLVGAKENDQSNPFQPVLFLGRNISHEAGTAFSRLSRYPLHATENKQ